MTEINALGYRIDYERPDVADLVAQIRARVHRLEALPAPTAEAVGDQVRARLQIYLDPDPERPHRWQRELGLEPSWNVSPEDLRRSERPGLGPLIVGLRRLLRPLLKMMVNLDLPFYKQFRVNAGVAKALSDLLRETTALRVRVDELAARLDRLERGSRPSASPGSRRQGGDDPEAQA